jgi:hypothetical protein
VARSLCRPGAEAFHIVVRSFHRAY